MKNELLPSLLNYETELFRHLPPYLDNTSPGALNRAFSHALDTLTCLPGALNGNGNTLLRTRYTYEIETMAAFSREFGRLTLELHITEIGTSRTYSYLCYSTNY